MVKEKSVAGLYFRMLATGIILLMTACAPARQAGSEVTETAVQPADPTRTQPVNTEVAVTLQPTDTAVPDTPVPPTEIAVIEPPTVVRRLNAAVFAGLADRLSELGNNDPFNLDAGGQVSTNVLGEAEVVIQDCLKLFIFQDAGLTRSTCRKDDFGSGLSVCATAGLTGVLNNCSSQIDIQTPVSRITTDGTWFAVLYLPDEQMNIVQVYEGTVGVSARTNVNAEQYTPEEQLQEGEMWFTQPGSDAPQINGINGREPQPLEVWEAVRPDLLQNHPELDKWFSAARGRAEQENLTFPDFIAREEGQVTLHVSGTPFDDEDAQEAFLAAIPWQLVVKQAFTDYEVRPRVEFSDRTIEDARIYEYEPDRANRLLSRSNFYNYNNSDIQLGVPETDRSYEVDPFALTLQGYLSAAGFDSNYFTGDLEGIRSSAEAANSADFPMVWVSVEGEAFDDD